jgi:hypothetical protein
MPGSPEGEQPFFSNLFKALYPDRDQKRTLRDTPTDYSAMFAYIRADKSTPEFLADLRDNKTHLLSCFDEVFDDSDNPKYEEPSGLRTLETKYHVAMHLDTLLQVDVYDMDPYREKAASPMHELDEDDIPFTSEGAEVLFYRGAAALHSSRTASLAAEWLETHPDSEAAKEIALLGADAPLHHRQRFLQEMWPTYVTILTGQSEKKS